MQRINAAIKIETNKATIGCPKNVITLPRDEPEIDGICPQIVLAKIKTRGTNKVANEIPAPGSFSVSSNSAKSEFSKSWPAATFASILSNTLNWASVYFDLSIWFGTTTSLSSNRYIKHQHPY